MKYILLILALVFYPEASHALHINLSDYKITKDQTFTAKEVIATFECANCEVLSATVIGENKSFLLSQEEKNGSKVFLQKTFRVKNIPIFCNVFTNNSVFISHSDKEIINQIEGKFSTSYGVKLREYLFEKKLYSFKPSSIVKNSNNMHQFTFTVPSAAVTGKYKVQVKLFKFDGTYLKGAETNFIIQQSGFYNKVVRFSYNSPFLYALSTVLFAVILGGLGGLTNLDMLRRTKAF